MRIRVGTRGSALAQYQTSTVVAALEKAGADVEVVLIQTQGDQNQHAAFAQVGAPGVFVRAIEEALQEKTIDLAVHSYKDLPSFSPEGLTVVAVPPREDPSDAVLSMPDSGFDSDGLLGLRPGARVGTASARRKAWLGRLDQSLQVEHLRGNLPRRIERLREGAFDAILLASAGLDRIAASGFSLDGITVRRLHPAAFIPAPTQGALALQAREEDDALCDFVSEHCGDPPTEQCVEVERDLLRLVEGGCVVPFGAWCHPLDDEHFALHAALEKEGNWFESVVTGPETGDLAEQLWSSWRQELM